MSGKNVFAMLTLAAIAGLAGFFVFEHATPFITGEDIMINKKKVHLPEYPAQEMQSMEFLESNDEIEKDDGKDGGKDDGDEKIMENKEDLLDEDEDFDDYVD
jgi:hypothetical protein